MTLLCTEEWRWVDQRRRVVRVLCWYKENRKDASMYAISHNSIINDPFPSIQTPNAGSDKNEEKNDHGII